MGDYRGVSSQRRGFYGGGEWKCHQVNSSPPRRRLTSVNYSPDGISSLVEDDLAMLKNPILLTRPVMTLFGGTFVMVFLTLGQCNFEFGLTVRPV